MNEHELAADPSNAGMVAAWDGNEGEFWAAKARRLDETLARSHGPFLAAAAVGEHDRILDIGCGTGLATRDVGRIAIAGSAVGVDLSSAMIALARETAADEGLSNVEFRQADAQIHPFEAEGFDAVISRMGSMFFGDPVAGFANIGRALRPGGRLTLLTWQALDANEWLTQFRAAVAVGRDLPVPGVPGPFSLADPDRVTEILEAAGFADITFDGLHEPMSYGTDPEDAFEWICDLTRWMLDGLDEVDRGTALASLRASVAAHAGPLGVTYASATWIIRARKP